MQKTRNEADDLPGEEWKRISGFSNAYCISTHGRVWSIGRRKNCGHLGALPQFAPGRIMKLNTTKKGYKTVCLRNGSGSGFTLSVHRLVAVAFIQNPENKPEVNHKDGVKNNNHVSNLEWVTSKENNEHARKNSLNRVMRGMENGFRILSDEAVREIKLTIAKNPRKKMGKILAEKFGVSVSTISLIRRNHTWVHVPCPDL